MGGLCVAPTSASRGRIPAGVTSTAVGGLRVTPTLASRRGYLLVPPSSSPPAEGACLLVLLLQPKEEDPLPPLQQEGEEPLPPSQPEGEEPLPPSPGADQPQEINGSCRPRRSGRGQETSSPRSSFTAGY
ncbi:UNVERIFIED_CONTAM: hypothetical protein FKN15_059816 [Acipenser sinensis]